MTTRERLTAARAAITRRAVLARYRLRMTREWTAAALVAAAPDLLGLLGFALICAGVYVLRGLGWTLIAAGVPPFTAYLLRELGPSVLARRRRK